MKTWRNDASFSTFSTLPLLDHTFSLLPHSCIKDIAHLILHIALKCYSTFWAKTFAFLSVTSDATRPHCNLFSLVCPLSSSSSSSSLLSLHPSQKHPVHASILTKTQLVWVCMWAGCSSFIYVSLLVRQPSSGADGCSAQLDSAIVPLVIGTWNQVPH